MRASHRVLVVASLLVAGAVADGCAKAAPASATGDSLCAPGQQIACACADGSMGAQACAEDGAGYDKCQCASSASTGASSGSGGHGGASTAATSASGVGPDTASSTSSTGGASSASSASSAASTSSGGLGCTVQASPGLAAWYRFDESSGVVCDSSGNGNDGNLEGAGYQRAVAGKIGTAIRFLGSDGRVNVPASPSLDMLTAGTIELWVWLDDINMNPKSTVSRGTGNNDDNVLMNATCGNMQTIFSRTGSGTTNVTSACNVLPAMAWKHIAIVNDGVTLSMYVDDVLTTSAPGGYLGPLKSNLFIGRREQGVFTYSGMMDEIKWWTVARTQQEICVDAGGSWMGAACSLP